MSIKNKTIILLIIALAVSGIIIGSVGTIVLYNQTLHSTEVAMNNQTAQLVGQVVDLFDSFNKNGKAYQSDTDLQSGDKSRIQAKLSLYFGTSWGVDRLNFVDAAGKRIAIMPYEEKVIGDDLSDRKYFQDTMNDQQSHVSEAIISRATGMPSIIITQPIKAQTGQMTGMVLQAVNLDTLQKFLAQMKVGSTGVVAIVTNDGTLIAHSHKELIKAQKKIPNELRQRFTDQPGRLVKYMDVSGRESLALALPIQDTGWKAVVSLPTREFNASFNSSLLWMIITLIISLIVVGLIGWKILLKTLRPVDLLIRETEIVAAGDLTISTALVQSNDEIGRLAKNFAKMTNNLRILMQKVTEATDQVVASSEELNAGAEQSSQAANQIADSINKVAKDAEEQLTAVNDTSAVVEQVSASIQQIAANANQVAAQSVQAADKAKDGDKSVGKAVIQMNKIEETVNTSAQVVAKLGERSQEIGQIVDTIASIAGQTNLLALNAAIESARAGEQGRGFAVVAEEVRKLAEQSQEAAKKIAGLIGEVKADTEKAVIAMDEGTREVKTGTEVVNIAGSAFREIIDLVAQVSDQVKEISAAIQQMAVGSQQIVGSVAKIDDLSKKSASESQNVSAATEEQLASMEEISGSSRTLAQLAQNLRELVTKFHV